MPFANHPMKEERIMMNVLVGVSKITVEGKAKFIPVLNTLTIKKILKTIRIKHKQKILIGF
jgi:hypothetical protein